MPLLIKEKQPFTKEQKIEVKTLLLQRRILINANQEFKKVLSDSQYSFLNKDIREKRKQLASIVASNEKRIVDIVKRLAIFDKERTKINYRESFKQLFQRNKVNPEEVTSKSSANENKSKQVTMPKAIAKEQTKTSYWQSFKKLFTRNQFTRNQKVNFDLLTNYNQNEETEIENLKNEPIIPEKIWSTTADIIALEEPVKESILQPNSDRQSTDDASRTVTPVVVHPQFNSDAESDEDDNEFIDASDEPFKESILQPNSDRQSAEDESRTVTPVVVHPQPNSDAESDEDDDEFIDASDEPFKESILQPNSDAESDEDDASRVLTDDGYHTQNSSDAEIDTLIIGNTNSKPILKSQINSLPNQIVIEKVRNFTWKIEQNSENNKTSKEILLKKEEDNILENFIKEYKSNILITFDKNSKKFKEAFIIDNQGNKKNIVINEHHKILVLEKVFAKVTATLTRSWNDSYVDLANNFEKKQSLSNARKLKTHNEKKWIRHLGKI